MRTPNEVHRVDLIFLLQDKVGRKMFKYALTLIGVALLHYKEAKPMPSKTETEVTAALERIYRWPILLQVNPGHAFMGAVSHLLAKHGISVRCGIIEIHQDQGIVERFNRTLTEWLFGHQYAQVLVDPSKCLREWVHRITAVLAALNREVTPLMGQQPVEAIRDAMVSGAHATTPPGGRQVLKTNASHTTLLSDICISQPNWRAVAWQRLILCGP